MMKVVKYNKGLLKFEQDTFIRCFRLSDIAKFRNPWEDVYMIQNINEQTKRLQILRVLKGAGFSNTSDLIEVDLETGTNEEAFVFFEVPDNFLEIFNDLELLNF